MKKWTDHRGGDYRTNSRGDIYKSNPLKRKEINKANKKENLKPKKGLLYDYDKEFNHHLKETWFTYNGENYRVDEKGNIHEGDTVSGRKNIGKIDKNGNFNFKKSFLHDREIGYFSKWTGHVHEKSVFGGRLKIAGERLCFLTTACVEYAGLPDNCIELRTLRNFRDQYVRFLPEGTKLIEEYYKTAPLIVQNIKSDKNTNTVLCKLLINIRYIVKLIQNGYYSEALQLYKQQFQKLKNKYKIISFLQN